MDQDSEDDDPSPATIAKDDRGYRLAMDDPSHGYALLEAVKNGRYRQAKLMLETGSGINVLDKRSGQSLLVLCCTHLHDTRTRSKFVALLLDAGVDPNVGDQRGMSAMMHAAILGQVETIMQLVDHPNIDLEMQDMDGNTALMYAASFGHSDIVALLLGQMGRLRQVLHLSQRNHSGHTALQLAERHGHQSVALELGGGLIANENPGPALSLPLMASFPIRWRRQKIAHIVTDEDRDSDAIAQIATANDRDSDAIAHALPRLAWTKEDDVCQSLTIGRRLPEHPSSPTRTSASHDEFRKVLSLLDAAMDADDRSLQTTPDPRDCRDKIDTGTITRSYRCPIGGYFPPIRPVRTTALPPIAGDSRRRTHENYASRFTSPAFPHRL